MAKDHTFPPFFWAPPLALLLSGASEPPDPRECEETRWELPGGHPPSFGHCQGKQHEAAEAEEGGTYFKTKWSYIFQLNGHTLKRPFLSLICLSGGADSPAGNEAEDGKARRRSFEAFVEHSNWFWPLTKRQYS